MTLLQSNGTSPMEHLTQDLAEQVQALREYFRSIGRVQPSFDRSTPIVVLPEQAPKQTHIARERIMDYALKLFELAAGPSEYMINIQTGYHYIACLQWLCHFNIFNLVPAEDSISYTDLASLANVSETRLKSVVRMAMTNGLFTEPLTQRVAHSATSALFYTSEDYRNWAVFACDISVPVAGSMAEAHKKWPNDTKKTHTAQNIAFNHDLPFFQRLSQNPELHKQFAGYMRAVATDQGQHTKHLVAGFDWASLHKALIVDVGGSTGHACIALAQAYMDLNFIVQDLPEVVAGGNQILASLKDTSVSRRIEFQGHSFFEPQPVVGADIYLFRMVLHDWPFDDCVKILACLVPALRSGSRIIIMDCVLPAPGTIPRSTERVMRVRDLTMTQMFNSQERALEDWEFMFLKVDSRLKIRNVTQPFGSVLALIEVQLVDE